MGTLTQSEIIAFYADLHAERDRKETMYFCSFLDRLFESRDLSGCIFFTSLNTFCIARYPAEQRRYKPLLSVGIASSARILIQLRLTQETEPALRATTESSSAPWSVALDEFDRLYQHFLDAHRERE